MIKKIVIYLILGFLLVIPAVAVEKIPVSITPAQIISTSHDEVETGDELDFKLVKDIYNGDLLLFKKDAPVLALVDYVSDNGFAADSAYIQIKKFKILDAKKNWQIIHYPLKISGLQCRDKKANIFYKGFHSIAFLIRGYEIDLKPGQKNFNIFMDKMRFD